MNPFPSLRSNKYNFNTTLYDIKEKPLKTHKNRYITSKNGQYWPLVGSSATPRNQLGVNIVRISQLYNGFCSFLRFFINIILMSNGKMSGNNWSLIEKLFRVRTFTLPLLIHCQRFTKLIVKFFFCLDLGTYASNINSRSTNLLLKKSIPFFAQVSWFYT